MTDWFPLICPVCGHELPDKGNRRVRIPWLGGRLKLVHPECVEQVEAQGTLPERAA